MSDRAQPPGEPRRNRGSAPRPRLRFRAASPPSPGEIEFAFAKGLYVGSKTWHHFVTLTADGGASSDWLQREYKQGFIRRLEFDAKGRIDYFVAIEHDESTGQFAHLHALLHGTAGLTVETIRSRWGHGFTDVAPYDRRQHAAHYVVKNLLLDPDAYQWSRLAPPPLVQWTDEEFRAAVAELRRKSL
jgi:hypothetical protein